MSRPWGHPLSHATWWPLALSLVLAPAQGLAAPGSSPPEQPDNPANPANHPVEGPTPPPSDAAPSDAPEQAPPGGPGPEIPAPHIDPPHEPGIEFKIPPPAEDEEQTAVAAESPLAATFPDPGQAPDDGNGMLVLSGTAIGLTAVAFSAGVVVGLQDQVPLSWLLPSTIIPAVGVLAFAGGGLYLGIQRRVAYRRWEIGYRVIGSPQGNGLRVGASFMLLAALGLTPTGAFALYNGDNVELGAAFIAVGSAAAVATPIMFAVAGKHAREVRRTGGWHRRPIPPLPPQARLQLAPLVAPTPGGFSLGVRGRF